MDMVEVASNKIYSGSRQRRLHPRMQVVNSVRTARGFHFPKLFPERHFLRLVLLHVYAHLVTLCFFPVVGGKNRSQMGIMTTAGANILLIPGASGSCSPGPQNYQQRRGRFHHVACTVGLWDWLTGLRQRQRRGRRSFRDPDVSRNSEEVKYLK